MLYGPPKRQDKKTEQSMSVAETRMVRIDLRKEVVAWSGIRCREKSRNDSEVFMWRGND